jgi:CrcB protein
MIKNIILVFIGGGLGSVLRYFASLIFSNKNNLYSTLLVNVVGSFCIGLTMSYLVKKNQPILTTQLLVITGLLGGFTTFSAFSWHVLELIKQQQIALALLYILLTCILSFIAVSFGYYIIK